MSEADEGDGRERVRLHFRHQAEACDTLGSPFTAAVCRAVAEVLDETTAVGRRALSWPGNTRDDGLSLRFCGGLHALVLSQTDEELAAAYPPHADAGDLIRILPGAILRNDAALGRALDSAPQTNEIARAAMLLPGFLAIARETGLPLDICEIGSSAGLNLLFDRFSYDFGGTPWGDPASPVRLTPEIRGESLPLLDGTLSVSGRGGSDIRPIDIGVSAERLRLRSYVWADQTLRLAHLDAAIDLAEANPFVLEQTDAATFVRHRFAASLAGVTRVLFHSIMWQYLPDATKAAISSTVLKAAETATSSAPIAWLRMEPLDTRNDHATLSLTLWPHGKTRHLAKCDYHGRWIEWLA